MCHNEGIMKTDASILVLYGGTSPEREIALRSGAAVAKALQAKYKVELVDYNGTLPAIIEADVVFPVLHGLGGEDGRVQEQLESRNLAYVGSSAAASRVCFDKWQHKQLLRNTAILTPQAAVVGADELVDHDLIKAPFVLKPFDGGSSVDTFIVRDPATADLESLQQACERHGRMLLEELIIGTEITVGVLEGIGALPVIEIIPPADGEFDYENKYNGRTQELCPAVNVSIALQQQAQTIAEQVHTISGCRDMSRTDIIIDAEQRLYVLEINTIPGMTDQSLFPKAAAAAGITMTDLCGKLISNALSRL
jgi:D-alanine-D-alanine ligase